MKPAWLLAAQVGEGGGADLSRRLEVVLRRRRSSVALAGGFGHAHGGRVIYVVKHW